MVRPAGGSIPNLGQNVEVEAERVDLARAGNGADLRDLRSLPWCSNEVREHRPFRLRRSPFAGPIFEGFVAPEIVKLQLLPR